MRVPRIWRVQFPRLWQGWLPNARPSQSIRSGNNEIKEVSDGQSDGNHIDGAWVDPVVKKSRPS